MASSSFKIGDFVFAKMKGYCYWPGLVVRPTGKLLKHPSASKKGMHCIFFFGTNNYRWLESFRLKDYFENRYLSNFSKATNFKNACKEIEEYIKRKSVNINQVTNDELSLYGETSKSVGKRSISPDAVQNNYKRKNLCNKNTSSFLLYRTELPYMSEECATMVEKPDKIDGELQNPKYSEGAKKESLYDKTCDEEQPSSSQVRNETDPSLTSEGSSSATYSGSDSDTSDNPPLRNKNPIPSSMNIGFIGLGHIGSGIVKNLLNSNHNVTIWNRSPHKCEKFIIAGAKGAMTPGDVMQDADITFCCVSGEDATRGIVFGNCGVLPEVHEGKAFVEMSCISKTASKNISQAIIKRGGRYLEVRFHGCRPHADQGTLTVLASGDKSLFDDCASCFSAFSIKAHFLGEIGKASGLAPLLSSFHGVMLSACCEILMLSSHFNITQECLLNLCKELNLLNPFILQKFHAAMNGYFSPKMTIKDLKKATELSLEYANESTLDSSMIAFAHERIKFHMSLGHGDLDIAKLCVPKSLD